MPDIIPRQVIARIVTNDRVMPGVFLLWLEATEIACIAKAGQFVMLKCHGRVFLRRPLSIHRVNENKTHIAFIFAVVGKGTDWLSKLTPDDTIDLLGPLGQGFKIAPSAQNLILMAGGLGIAPLRFLADEAQEQGKLVMLLLGASTSEMLCPEHLLPSDSNCVLNTDDGTRGRKGFVTECLSDYAARADQIFACGPLPMLRTMAREILLKDKDVQISLETRMACGLGICYGCSIKTLKGMKQVCKDGPVFNLNDISWDEIADI
jgi:dihydroorotate dehydrogenase electron transfer subunit